MTFWRLWRRRPPPNEPSERTPEPATPSGRRWDARFSTRLLPRIERLLAEAEREFGPDHPDTVIFRSNLARAYAGAGDLDRAIPLFERILADRERLLGPDHPDTLAARNDLAEAYRAAGDLDRAIPCSNAPSPTRSECWVMTTGSPRRRGADSARPRMRLERAALRMTRLPFKDHDLIANGRGLQESDPTTRQHGHLSLAVGRPVTRRLREPTPSPLEKRGSHIAPTIRYSVSDRIPDKP